MESVKNKIYIAVIAVCAVAIIFLGVDYLNKDSQEESAAKETSIAELVQKEDKTVITVDTKVLQDGLANMGFLVTQEYYFTQVEKYSKEKKVLSIIPTESGFTYSYDGAVTAGIDFDKIEVKKDDNEKTLTVEIPKSRIQTVIIDKDTFKVYSEKDSLWNPIKIEDYNNSLSEYEDAAKKKAIENGILERSDEQAENLIKNFIENFTQAADYEVRFEWRTENEY